MFFSRLPFSTIATRLEENTCLWGVSCGTTLAFEVDQRSWHGQYRWELPQLAAVLGVEGIYDFDALEKYHGKETKYEDFIPRAFGRVRGLGRLRARPCDEK